MGMRTLREDGVRKVLAGLTTADEVIRATVGGVRVINVYVPNGQAVSSEKFPYKLGWLARLREEIAADSTPDRPLALLGDFNVAFADADVWDPFEAEGEELCGDAAKVDVAVHDLVRRLVLALALARGER